MPLDVLLVEPWFGGSHRAWAEGYQRHSAHNVELLTLPDQAWKWRMRGSAITLAERVSVRPDVVLASSLLDLASFLGHARVVLGDVPVLLYMHENQLTYPLPEGARRDMDMAFINWSSMVAADRVTFNSEFHRSAWFEAVPTMLRSHPEPRHLDLIEDVVAKSRVLPVGVELDWLDTSIAKGEPPLLMWNQRWEHDKNPDTLAWALGQLVESDVSFRVAICGEAPFSTVPESIADLRALLGDRLVQFGFADREVYEALLGDASVVVSTAHHEFFGVSVIEAMAAGAIPILPDRLSYPELIPESEHDRTIYGNRSELIEKLSAALTRPAAVDQTTSAALRFDWEVIAPDYDEAIAAIA